jgi:hypothetical protein
MGLILRQAGAILLSLVGLYMIALAATLALAPRPPERQWLNTARAEDTIFMTEPKYIYLNRSALRDPVDKVIVVGASNSVRGFTRAELGSLVPRKAAVHNLALGGANMTEVRQVIDLVEKVQTPEAQRRTVFVVGVWYGMFGEDRLHWFTPDRSAGDTDIDIERYRYGFERRTQDGPVALVPERYFGAAVTAIYPFLFLDKLARDATGLVVSREQPDEAALNAVVLSEDDRVKYLRYWSSMMGPEEPRSMDEQFGALARACEAILAHGSRVVLVDLPLPKWHKDRSPYYRAFEDQEARLVAALSDRPGFSFVDLGELDRDDDFIDEVHPKPRVTLTWSRELARVLSPLLASGPTFASTAPDQGTVP